MVKLPPEDEYLAYSKRAEDVTRIKLKKVHLDFIIQFILMHGQYNIKKVACLFFFVFLSCLCTSNV